MECLRFNQAKQSNQPTYINSCTHTQQFRTQLYVNGFELCFVMPKEGFSIYEVRLRMSLHQLEVRHEVDLGMQCCCKDFHSLRNHTTVL